MMGIGRRRMLAGGGAAVAGLSAPALAASERELRFMPQVDLVTLDPHYSMTNITRNHAGLVFDQLYGTDSHQQASPRWWRGT
jgi:peptide/nickel transport system substrate-binding protein